MPRHSGGGFGQELEKRIIELWAEEQQRNRGAAEKIARCRMEIKVADELNAHAIQLYGEETAKEHLVTAQIVKNKIDNLRAKAKKRYRNFTSPASGASPGDGSGLNLEAASISWPNFRVWHDLFQDIPEYGPLSAQASIDAGEVADNSSGPTTVASSTSNTRTCSASSVSNSVASVAAAAGRETSIGCSVAALPPLVIASTAATSRSSSNSAVPPLSSPDGREGSGSAALPAGSSSVQNTAVPSGKRKRSLQHSSLSDSDTEVVQVVAAPKRSKSSSAAQAPSSDQVSAVHAVADTMAVTLSELQASNQQFLASLIQQQQIHTQALIQSQMEFTAKLFDKYFG